MTSTPLHLAPDPADVDIHTLRAESFRAAARSDARGLTVDAAWHLGVGVGVTYGLAVAGGDVETLAAAASYRRDSTPGATDVDSAMYGYFGTDLARRCQVAMASGVQHGFRVATEERSDAQICRNCGQRVLTDLEDHEVCGSEHGVFCGSECREGYCTRSCYAADGPLTLRELRGDA